MNELLVPDLSWLLCLFEAMVVHECTSHFVRQQFPDYLPDYSWHWPSRYDDGPEPDPEGDAGVQDDVPVPERILELSPCYFGWPATRNRSYTVPCLRGVVVILTQYKSL